MQSNMHSLQFDRCLLSLPVKCPGWSLPPGSSLSWWRLGEKACASAPASRPLLLLGLEQPFHYLQPELPPPCVSLTCAFRKMLALIMSESTIQKKTGRHHV